MEVKLTLRSANTNAVAVKLHVNLMLNIALKYPYSITLRDSSGKLSWESVMKNHQNITAYPLKS
jgi:hypothetical protein